MTKKVCEKAVASFTCAHPSPNPPSTPTREVRFAGAPLDTLQRAAVLSRAGPRRWTGELTKPPALAEYLARVQERSAGVAGLWRFG